MQMALYKFIKGGTNHGFAHFIGDLVSTATEKEIAEAQKLAETSGRPTPRLFTQEIARELMEEGVVLPVTEKQAANRETR